MPRALVTVKVIFRHVAQYFTVEGFKMKKEAKLKTFSTWEKVTKKRNLLLKHVHTTVSPGFHFLNAHIIKPML